MYRLSLALKNHGAFFFFVFTHLLDYCASPVPLSVLVAAALLLVALVSSRQAALAAAARDRIKQVRGGPGTGKGHRPLA